MENSKLPKQIIRIIIIQVNLAKIEDKHKILSFYILNTKLRNQNLHVA